MRVAGDGPGKRSIGCKHRQLRRNFVLVAMMILMPLLTAVPELIAQQLRYKLIDMGTLGGPNSFINDGNGGNNAVQILNDRGTLVGWADTSTTDPFAPDFCFTDSCFVSHGFQSKDGVLADLGALDNNLGSQAVWISANGLIAGFSENGEIDPSISGVPESHAVLWNNRRISDLGTLEGGFESTANAVNSQGQVVGWSTNNISDPNSMAAPGFLPTQTRAFLWQNGTMQDLNTLGTGTDATAQFINERGQVVGWSYTSSSPNTSCPFFLPLTVGSFIWDEKNGMKNLGSLGGTCVIATGVNDAGVVVGDNVNDQVIQRAFIWKNGAIRDLGGTIGGAQAGAEAINGSGEVAGFATIAGEIIYHATLWRRVGEITDLGVLDGDLCSFASSINSKSQIVGASQTGTEENGCTSFDVTPPRAFLWENGAIFDLNALIPPGASLNLTWAQAINDRGEIAGVGLDVNSNQHGFLLIPCDDNSRSDCHEIFAGVPATPFSKFVSPIQANSNPRSRQRPRRLPGILRPMRAQ